MRHVLAILVKFISLLIVLYVFLGLIFDLSFADVLGIAAVLTAVGYVLGDLYLLPRTSNLAATLADFGLAFIIVWFMSRAAADSNDLFTASLICAAAVAIIEYVYHSIVPVNRRTLNKTDETDQNIQSARTLPRALVKFNQRPGHERLQTEASEELFPSINPARSKKRKGSKLHKK
ncbi:YndM family protein [Peribacillus sp. SCS-155]|uniref:YndM family protein n=1 Tax=Peribacillus sedimenti TaxID=3115297 RepID=UPI0039066C75